MLSFALPASAPNTVRGVYLPLLLAPGDCVKEPLVVFFDGGHFTALCRIDDAEPTPGLIQLDFVVERASIDRQGRVCASAGMILNVFICATVFAV
jgi:hypothetical protein